MRFTASLLGLRYKIVNPVEAKFRLSAQSSGPKVVVVNHQSSLDVLALLCHLWPLMDGQCTIISKKSLLFTGPFGVMAYMSGVTFIDRSKQQLSIDVLNQTMKECKETNKKMIVFAEGTRFHHPDKIDMLPFKLGAFHAALSSKVPIQPVVLSHYEFYDHSRKILEPGMIRINVLEEIKSDHTLNDAKSLAMTTRNLMLETFQH